MASLTFPLAVATFWNLLNIAETEFSLSEAREVNITGGGNVIDANLGTRLWRASVRLAPALHADAQDVEALVELLKSGGSSFLAYDIRRQYPRSDPTGTILGASATLLNAVSSDNREIRISGLPANYVMSRGDYVAFDYSAGARRALHKVVQGVTASAGGLTPVMEVVPPVRPGFTIGGAVSLARPAMRAKIVPGSVTATRGLAGLASEGVIFDMIQTLK